MWRSACCTTAGLLWLCAFSGCAQRACCQAERRTCPGSTVAETIPAVSSPGEIATNWPSLPSLDRVNEALGAEPAVSGYRTVTAEQCQCQAAANAALGNMLTAECRLICSTRVDRHGMLTPADALLADLLAARAIEERNKASAAALELFYHLAEAQLHREVLGRSLQETDHAIASYRQLHERGLALPTDDSALQRQRFDLLGRKVQLDTSARQADGQLCRLLAVPSDPLTPQSPVADLTVSVVPVDVEAAVGLGLAMRPDLAMLQMLCERLSADTLATVRSGMQQLGGLLGAASAVQHHKLLKSGDDTQLACEQQMRQTQLALALGDQTRAAEEEIRQAAREVDSRLRQAALAKQKWASWQQHVQGLRERHESAKATEFDINAAQLQTLQAESDAVAALVAWKIAQVKLKQAQGVLARECGCRLR